MGKLSDGGILCCFVHKGMFVIEIFFYCLKRETSQNKSKIRVANVIRYEV